MAVAILGVNRGGYESGNAAISDGRDIPWLQETAASQVWGPWGARWRDVIILDGDNVAVRRYNLTDHPLSNPLNYLELKTILAGLAGGR